MNTYESLSTSQLERKYAGLSHILDTNTIGNQQLTQAGRDLVCNEMAVIAGILDNREWVTDAGPADCASFVHYDENGKPVGIGRELMHYDGLDDYAIQAYA